MKVLDFLRSYDLLKGFLEFADHKICKNLEECLKFAKSKNFKVVLKLISKEFVHKTEKGLVKICNNKNDVEKNFNIFRKKLKGKIIVQEFIDGREFIIGIKKDETFGHFLLFGIGGKYTEFQKDFSLRIIPLNLKDVDEMIKEIKQNWLIYGGRDLKPINILKMKNLIIKFSKVVEKLRNLKEIDINPLIANENEIKAVDARIVLE